MATKKQLRQISNYAYAATVTSGTPVAVGGAVPTGKRRIIYRVIVSHGTNPGILNDVQLWSNGITATTALDRFNLPAAATYESVQVFGKNITTPVYILTTGQQLGITAAVAGGGAYIVTITVLYFDEI